MGTGTAATGGSGVGFAVQIIWLQSRQHSESNWNRDSMTGGSNRLLAAATRSSRCARAADKAGHMTNDQWSGGRREMREWVWDSERRQVAHYNRIGREVGTKRSYDKLGHSLQFNRARTRPMASHCKLFLPHSSLRAVVHSILQKIIDFISLRFISPSLCTYYPRVRVIRWTGDNNYICFLYGDILKKTTKWRV